MVASKTIVPLSEFTQASTAPNWKRLTNSLTSAILSPSVLSPFKQWWFGAGTSPENIHYVVVETVKVLRWKRVEECLSFF